jgi:hypothetical protein
MNLGNDALFNMTVTKVYEKAEFKKLSTHTDTKQVQSNKVRLSNHDIDALKMCFKKHFLAEDTLWLFGSRADPSKKGGDIDLYIETHAIDHAQAITMKGNFLWDLEQKIGEQKIDIVLNLIKHPYPLPIHQVALREGVRLI